MGHFMALSLAVSRALDRAVDAQAATRLRLSIQASAGMRLLVLAVLLIVLFPHAGLRPGRGARPAAVRAGRAEIH